MFVLAAAVMTGLVLLNQEPPDGSMDGWIYAFMGEHPFEWNGRNEPFFSRFAVPFLVYLLPFGLSGFHVLTVLGTAGAAVVTYKLADHFGGRPDIAAAAFMVSGPVWPSTMWPHLIDGPVLLLAGLIILLAVRDRPVAALALMTGSVFVHETVLLLALPLVFLLPRRWVPALAVPAGLFGLLRYTPVLYGVTIDGGDRMLQSPPVVFEKMSDYYGGTLWAVFAIWAASFGPLWVIPRWPWTLTTALNTALLPMTAGWTRSLTVSTALICAHANRWAPVAVMGVGQGLIHWWRPEVGLGWIVSASTVLAVRRWSQSQRARDDVTTAATASRSETGTMPAGRPSPGR